MESVLLVVADGSEENTSVFFPQTNEANIKSNKKRFNKLGAIKRHVLGETSDYFNAHNDINT